MKFCVIGIGRFGYHVATKLAEDGMDVLAVDSNESIVASVRDKVTQAICMRVKDEDSLRSIGVADIDTVIVAMGENFAQSILVTAILKQKLHIPNVIARAVSTVHKDILSLIGADHVVLPEQEMGIRLADKLSLTFSSFMRITENYSVTMVQTPHRFVGKTIKECGLKDSYKVLCLGKKEHEEIKAIAKDYRLETDDILVFAGENKDLEKIAKL